LTLTKVSDHFLVPKHEIVPEDKIDEILKEFGITKDKLPQILKSETIVSEIGAKKGDVIKIIRNSPTAGKCIYFRIVN